MGPMYALPLPSVHRRRLSSPRNTSGRNATPVLKVINKADRELSLRIDDTRYTVANGKTLEVSPIPGGMCKFLASAPGAIPLSGTHEWKRGYT